MKSYLQKLTRVMRNRGKVLLAMTAVFSTALVTNSHAAVPFGDPTGNDWDFVVKGGGQDGIMFLHFTKDLDPNNNLPTFEGIFVYAGNRHPATPTDRNTGGTGRTGSSPNTFTNLFGGGIIQGTAGRVANNGGSNDWFAPDSTGLRGDWFYNAKGQIVASYFTVIFLGVTTNGITNNVSFTANLVPSKRMTLSASSSFGNFSAIGVPLVATTAPVDTFTWTANRNLGSGFSVIENFSLSPTSIPNAFSLTGSGPSYTYDPGSFCLISSQKRIGFAIAEDTADPLPITTGTAGPFRASTKAISANTSGFIATQTNRISFNAAAVMVP